MLRSTATSALGAKFSEIPASPQQYPDLAADLPGQLDIVGPAQRGRARKSRSGGRVQPGDIAGLLVNGDDQVRPERQQRAGERPELRGVPMFLANRHTPPRPPDTLRSNHSGATTPSKHGISTPSASARSSSSSAAFGQVLLGLQLDRRHPFTAPAVSPAATLRWMIANRMTIGMATRVDAAINAPQSTPLVVMKVSSQTVMVCLVFCRSST